MAEEAGPEQHVGGVHRGEGVVDELDVVPAGPPARFHVALRGERQMLALAARDQVGRRDVTLRPTRCH